MQVTITTQNPEHEYTDNGIRLAEIAITRKIMKEAGYNVTGDVVIPSVIHYKDQDYKVTSIAKRGFWYSFKMKSVSIPETVMTIEDYAFSRCISLKQVIFRNKHISQLTYIGRCAFMDCKINSLTLPDTVKYMGIYSFSGNTPLQQIDLSKALTTIDEGALSYCPNLEAIELPDSVQQVEECAFEGCENLHSINLSPNMTKIKRGTFNDCWHLVKLDIPDNIVSIHRDAFMGCSIAPKLNVDNKY